MIALPISDNSMKSVRRRSGLRFFAGRSLSDNQRKGLIIKQTGIPTHLSIDRIVLTFINTYIKFFRKSRVIHCSLIAEIVRMKTGKIKKIVVVGPESTCKSTLCQQLAAHYNTLWCPEYAREYLVKFGMNYSYEDLLSIAKGQIELEDKTTQLAIGKLSHSPLTIHHSPIFIDTNMYVMKVWCEFVFGKSHSFILEQIERRKYDLYLLCNVDLPWVKDELREYPDLETRQKLYMIYKNIMSMQPVPWVDINGSYEERLQKAIAAVGDLLQNKIP